MNVEEFMPDDLEVQKAVVESFAADKAEQDEKLAEQSEKLAELQRENDVLKSKLAQAQAKIDEMKASLENVGEVLSKNSETELSSKVSLLDRELEIQDRFLGETRDHVIEVIREARDAAERDGRIRRAQLLESVLVANQPVGNLAKKRAALEKFFNDNKNILSGPVIAELEKCGISHKNGENYLLPAEIIKRTY